MQPTAGPGRISPDCADMLGDAGYLITIDGTHKRLATDLVLRYDGVRVPLTCAPAFRYDLMVTKEPIV